MKLLYESTISGNPDPARVDENYVDTHKTYEESMMLVKAQSFEQAYAIAEKKAKREELDYRNPYDQKVEWRLVRALDCFALFDEELKSGTELYSRNLRVPKEVPGEDVIRHYYPETVEDSEIDPYFVLRLKEYNLLKPEED
ncbi:DUF4288 domain-containing protein [Cohnella ginsengisoli]|uniref:DUF4288 domain-containing protein n=1 Tax=Cohnella ginsengisoli TaxID=425004 RepID=A0A9X4KJC2_9BACL|nr:DUF4288 domain-containing protein [Cohnella ginsengisoli]MDG0791267.1 DUF4288 domain-containing protein [Cohnella ginsengisoli]